MKITVRSLTDSKEVLNSARVTVWKSALDKIPSDQFMAGIYMSEHSPIRDKIFAIEIEGIKSWIATHFVRHHNGVTPYVATQRDDRLESEIPRDERGQGERVNMKMTLNAQSFINISRKRKCHQAHKETVKVWEMVLDQLKEIDPQLYSRCVAECIYRGFCPELYPCGYTKTPKAKKERSEYTKNYSIIEV